MRCIKFKLLSPALLLMTATLFSQVGINTNTPDASSLLDLYVPSTSMGADVKGLLPPRITLTQRNSIVTPAIGLCVYNTTDNQLEINTGTTATPIWTGTVSNSWNIQGNASTVAGTNFIGTTDAVDVVFKRENEYAGLLSLNNTAYGVGALANNGGLDNTAVGYNSLKANGGTNNIAIGKNALLMNDTGYGNIAIGVDALIDNRTSGYNIAIGEQSLKANNGGVNIALGYASLISNTQGSNNISIGVKSMSSNTEGNNNTAYGTYALNGNMTGNNNTAMGYDAGVNINDGSNNVTIGANAQTDSPSTSNQVVMGNENIRSANIAVAWNITSDRRLKGDIKDALGLDFIKSLHPVSYTRNNDASKKTEYGFIAQEVEIALNNASDTNNGIISKNSAGGYSVRYNDFIAISVKAIQDQAKQIEELTKRLEKLEKK